MTATIAAAKQSTLNARLQLACLAAVPVGVVVITVGLVLAGFVPPPPAHDTPNEIAAFYAEDTNRIRFGMMLALVGVGMWGPLVTVITMQMRRSAPKMLAYTQFGAGIAGWQFLLCPFLLFTAAAFRPERTPEITQALHDTGFIFLFMPLTTFVVQNLAIAVATLVDTGRRPVFPRWVGYVNLLEILLFVPVLLLTFFKTGSFAYHGALVFWVPFAIFFVWLFAMTWATWQAVLDEQDEDELAELAA